MANAKTTSIHREVLKKSWKITLKNKYLWLFGFFAAILGSGSEFEILFNNYGSIDNTSETLFSIQSFYQEGLISTIVVNVKDLFSAFPFQGILLLFIFVIVAIIVIWLAIVSQIALFDSIKKLSAGQSTNLDNGYKAGSKYFGPVFGINAVVKIILYALLLILGLPLVGWFLVMDNLLGALLFILFVFLIFTPLTVIVSFIVKYAVAYVVIKGYKAGDAVKASWNLFKKNWLVSIELAFILLVVGVLVGLAMIVLLGFIAIPFVLLSMVALFFGSNVGFAIALFVGVIIWFCTIALLGAAFVTYQYSAWTLLFLRIEGSTAPSRLVRWFTSGTQYFKK